MVVKTIIDNEQGRKWEVNRLENDRYTVTYYEFFQNIGWKKVESGFVEYWSKEAVEWEFDCEVA